MPSVSGVVNEQQGNVPVPDPSLLTTEALDREIDHLTTLLTERIAAERTLTNEQLSSRDKALVAALAAAKELIDGVDKVRAAEMTSMRERLTATETAYAALQLQVSGIEQRTGGSKETKASLTVVVTIAVSVAAVVVAVILAYNT
jgi:hypothetical protein